MKNCSPNKNALQATNFKVSLDQTKFPNVSFYCTAVTLPDVTNTAVQTNFRNVTTYVPSAKLQAGDLTMTALITEDLAVWEEIYNWMLSNRAKDAPPSGVADHLYCDLTLSIRTGKNTASREISFRNAFPTSLGGLEMNVQADAAPMTTSITFAYDYFELED